MRGCPISVFMLGAGLAFRPQNPATQCPPYCHCPAPVFAAAAGQRAVPRAAGTGRHNPGERQHTSAHLGRHPRLLQDKPQLPGAGTFPPGAARRGGSFHRAGGGGGGAQGAGGGLRAAGGGAGGEAHHGGQHPHPTGGCGAGGGACRLVVEPFAWYHGKWGLYVVCCRYCS
jgi:hypothetical protein